MGQLTFGIYPFPQAAPYRDLADRARWLEALGFDALWVADSTPMAYPGDIAFEAWSLLGALARETNRIRLGSLVSPAGFRHPLLLAMAVTTVDHVSGGRVTLGIGVGDLKADLEGMGAGDMPATQLVARLEEQIPIVERLLRGETVTAAGEHYRTAGAFIERPLQQPRPPIVIAAQGRRTLHLAARYADVWNSLGGQPVEGEAVSMAAAIDTTRRHVEVLDEACEAVGRAPNTLRRSVFAFRVDIYDSRDALADFVGRYRELGFEEFILDTPQTGDARTDAAAIERVATEVIPALRA